MSAPTSPPASLAAGAAALPGMAALLCAIVAAVDLGGPIFYPGLGKIAAEFRISPAQAQLSVTVTLIGGALSQPFIGPAGDLAGRRKVVLASLLALASFSLLTVVVTSFPALIVVRTVQGVVGSAGIVLARAIAHDVYPDPRLFTKIVSYLVVTTGACSLAGPLIAGALVAAYGWRAPVLLLAVLSALVTIAAIIGFRRAGDHAGGPGGEGEGWPGWASLGALLRSPVFLGSTALLSFSMGSLFTLFGLSPLLLGNGPRTSPLQVALLVSVLSCGFMAGAFVAGLRPPTLRIVRVSSAAIAAGFAIIALAMLAKGPSLATLIPGGLIVALASGYLNPVTLALALQSDPRLAGTASSWSSAISLAVAGVGTQLATLVYGGNIGWLIAIGVSYALLCWVSSAPALSGTAPPLGGAKA